MSINNDSDVTGAISIDGAAVTSTTTVAGQDVRLSFSATGSAADRGVRHERHKPECANLFGEARWNDSGLDGDQQQPSRTDVLHGHTDAGDDGDVPAVGAA